MILWEPCGTCGRHNRVELYPCGYRCATCAPAALVGRTIPDPAASVPAASPPRPARVYGTATDDPLGRTVTRTDDGRPFADRLPRRPCGSCYTTTRVAGHKGEHD